MRRTGKHTDGQTNRWLFGFCLLALLTSPAHGQSIAERAAQVRDGKVRMSFATRPGVCGSGEHITMSRSTDDWESYCESGPARVVLTMRDGELVDVDTHVGGRWRPARGSVLDLGMVSAPEAAAYLLTLASSQHTRAGKEAIFPATIADSMEVWPRLLEIAKRRDLPRATRKSAVFWLAQAAGEAVADDLAQLVDDENTDREIQEHAVFALSQLRGDQGVAALIEIAQTHRDRHVRAKAMFWLGQSDDPLVIALFEEILLRR